MIKQKDFARKFLVVLAITAIFLGYFVHAEAANLTVTTLNDEQNVNGNCSLREAIINSSGDNQSGSTDCLSGSGADTISFSVTGEITVGSDMPLTADFVGLTIAGPGALSLAINGNGYRIIHNTALLAISGLTLRNGSRGIANTGTITNMNNLIVTGNTTSGGAGVLNNGTITTMSDVTISGNHAINTNTGGGLFNTGLITTMTNVTISGNTADGNGGGGLFNRSDGTISAMTNVTISGNTSTGASGVGGGIYNQGTITAITNVTINGNGAVSNGGGIFNSGTLSLINTIVANSTSGGNCFHSGAGSFTSNGYNLSSDNTCSTYFTATGDLNNTDPMLGPLANNGGFTQTHRLSLTSPAVDTGTDSVSLPQDQRGYARPIDILNQGNEVTDTTDRGAFERQQNENDVAIPTLTEWGMIIFSMLAGVGAVYYMRRQRRVKN